jgi:DNA-binding transcriptional regulator YdaS (Cro superfamily)
MCEGKNINQYMKTREACSGERALAIVRVRSLLKSSVRYSSEASPCEQPRAFASAEQASGLFQSYFF